MMIGASAILTETVAAETPSLYERKPAKRNFASRRDQPRLTPEQAARQGRAVTLALRSFSSSGAAMAFLNNDQPELGRPLDLAVGSEGGLQAVEAALTLLTPVSG